MTQTQEAKKLGLSQSTISRAKNQIKQGDLFRKPVLKILEVQGHGDTIRAFVKKVNEVGK
jgi:hypothetical protein